MQNTPFERVLVTGGTGFIGRYVVARLVASGHRPTVSQFGVVPRDFDHGPQVDLVDLDVRDHAETARLVETLRPDLVIHLAGVTGQSDREGLLCEEVNHRATVYLLDRLTDTDVRKVIMVGTAAEYGPQPTPFREEMSDDARSPYAISRAKANRYALSMAATCGLPVTVLRLFSVYGIGQSMNMFLPQLISYALSGREFLMTAGTQLRDFVHADDVARAILMAAERAEANGHIINIAGGIGLMLSEVARTVWRYCRADERLLKIGAIEAEGDGAFDTFADIRLAERLLGWRPGRTFMDDNRLGEGLVEMIEHMRRSQGAAS